MNYYFTSEAHVPLESMVLDVLAKQVFLVCGARKTLTNVCKYRAEMVCEKND